MLYTMWLVVKASFTKPFTPSIIYNNKRTINKG